MTTSNHDTMTDADRLALEVSAAVERRIRLEAEAEQQHIAAAKERVKAAVSNHRAQKKET